MTPPTQTRSLNVAAKGKICAPVRGVVVRKTITSVTWLVVVKEFVLTVSDACSTCYFFKILDGPQQKGQKISLS